MIPLKVKEHRTTCRNIPATFRHATKRTNPSQRSRTIARLCGLAAKNVHEKSIVCSTLRNCRNVPKVSFATRVGDPGCGVGYYQ